MGMVLILSSIHVLGTGGMSIYGAPFEDENMNIPLDRAGLLVMLNDGTNLYTFF